MSWNILVVDDDKQAVERIMHTLKRADSNNDIGDIIVDSSVTANGTNLEAYDPESIYGINFQIVLIDYQLGCSFTGVLVSAWIALKMKVPRISLTTAPYDQDTSYFDGSILKREITDNPQIVIKQIADSISEYNAHDWLNKQYLQLVNEYHAIIDNDCLATQEQRTSIEILLDKYEKILDAKQEERIKEAAIIERQYPELAVKLLKNRSKEEELTKTINSLMEKLNK